MSGGEQKIESVEMAPVEAVIVEINPPKVTFDPATGVLDKAVAGYIEEENDFNIVPVGKVTTEPAISTIKNPARKDNKAPSVQVSGLVGKNTVFQSLVPHGYYRGALLDYFCDYSETEKQKIKEELERRAAQAVFNILGIDIQPKPKPKLKEKLLGAVAAWAKD